MVDEALEECIDRFDTPRGAVVEVAVLSLRAFEQAGAIGSASEADRYSYVHADVVLDKLDGRIALLMAEKAELAPEAARAIAEHALDAYVNSYYRSAKNNRDGLTLEAHLDATESLSHLVTAVFALHGRVRPCNKFLRWELEHFPLSEAGGEWSAERLLPRLQSIVSTCDILEQRALFRDVERLASHRGLAEVVESWEPDLAWLRNG